MRIWFTENGLMEFYLNSNMKTTIYVITEKNSLPDIYSNTSVVSFKEASI